MYPTHGTYVSGVSWVIHRHDDEDATLDMLDTLDTEMGSKTLTL